MGVWASHCHPSLWWPPEKEEEEEEEEEGCPSLAPGGGEVW